MEVSAGNIDDVLSDKFFHSADTSTFVPSFVPESASPWENSSIINKCKSMVISTCNFLHSVLGHLLMKFELPEVVYLGGYAYFPEQ